MLHILGYKSLYMYTKIVAFKGQGEVRQGLGMMSQNKY